MSKIIYTTDFFKCTFSTAKHFDEQMREMLDRYTADGWLLHSWQVIGMGEMCELVFFREAE